MDIIKSKTVAFTGHREIENEREVFEKLKIQVERAINNSYDTFLTGMAKGYDLLAGEVVIYLKRKYPNVKLIACVPYKSSRHYPGFSYEDTLVFDDVLNHADKIVYVSSKYTPGVFLKRDRFMVDNCSFVIAYLLREKSGTGYTVNYAKTLGVDVINLNKCKNFN